MNSRFCQRGASAKLKPKPRRRLHDLTLRANRRAGPCYSGPRPAHQPYSQTDREPELKIIRRAPLRSRLWQPLASRTRGSRRPSWSRGKTKSANLGGAGSHHRQKTWQKGVIVLPHDDQ